FDLWVNNLLITNLNIILVVVMLLNDQYLENVYVLLNQYVLLSIVVHQHQQDDLEINVMLHVPINEQDLRHLNFLMDELLRIYHVPNVSFHVVNIFNVVAYQQYNVPKLIQNEFLFLFKIYK